MQQHLQLLSLAFPVKMLAALAMLTILSPAIARLFETDANQTMTALWQSIGR
jgi:flagellar biosynthesis protein FliR